MKKAFLCLLCALLAALTACGGASSAPPDDSDEAAAQTPGAFEIYSLAAQKAGGMPSVHVSATVDYSLTAGGVSTPLRMLMDVKALSETAMEFVMTLGTDGAADLVSMKLLLSDAVLYMDIYGMKMKTPFTDGYSRLTESTVSDVMLDFTEWDLSAASVAERDGGYVISVTLPGDFLSGIIGGTVGALAAGAPQGFRMDSGDAGCVMTIDRDGNLRRTEITYSCAITLENEPMEMDMHMVMELSALDGNYVISAPADAYDYLEVDESILGDIF